MDPQPGVPMRYCPACGGELAAPRAAPGGGPKRPAVLAAGSLLLVALVGGAVILADGEDDRPGVAAGGAAAAGAKSLPVLWEGVNAKTAVRQLREAVGGPLRATRLLVYDTYVVAQLQNPSRPDQFDDYRIVNGALDTPRPVRRHDGDGLEQQVFDVDPLPLELIPAIHDEALRRIPTEGGTVSHIIAERSHYEPRDVIFRAFVDSPRKSGVVDFKAVGAELEVVP